MSDAKSLGADVQKEWDEFWEPIVAPGGDVDLDQVKRELFDYSGLMHRAAMVYEHVTGGRISKVNTCALAIISEADSQEIERRDDMVRDTCQELEAQRDEAEDAADRIGRTLVDSEQRVADLETALREIRAAVADWPVSRKQEAVLAIVSGALGGSDGE